MARTRFAKQKEQQFAEELVKTGSQAQAARNVGYKGNSVRTSGHRMAQRPRVKKLIAEAQKAVQAKINYGLEQAMAETTDAMDFARQTENANAYVRAVEHRAKLNGLLVEKHQVETAGFQIVFGAFGQVPPRSRSLEDDQNDEDLLG